MEKEYYFRFLTAFIDEKQGKRPQALQAYAQLIDEDLNPTVYGVLKRAVAAAIERLDLGLEN